MWRRSAATCFAGLLLLTQGQTRAGSPDDSKWSAAASDEFVVRESARRFQLRVGLRIQAKDGPVQRAVATVVNPIEWPEQELRLVSADLPKGTQVQTRRFGGTAEQIILRLPNLARGSTVLCTRTYKVTRWTQRLKFEARAHLSGVPAEKARAYLRPSDGIESQHPEVRAFASASVANKTDPLARAAALFHATRERVQYVEGPFAGALAGLRASQGDCEERSCLFIAACRACDIPARLIWGPGHCWAEFAMSDEHGQLVWIPADPSKERELGVINHFDPIYQKGDRFTVPDAPGKPVRYLAPRCSGAGSAPILETIEELEPIDGKK